MLVSTCLGYERRTASAYPDNLVGLHTRTRRGRIDYVFYTRGSTDLVLRQTRIPDSRDLSNTNVTVTLGTLDDLGVRPSDHNHMVSDFDLLQGSPQPTPTPTPPPPPTPTPPPPPHRLPRHLQHRLPRRYPLLPTPTPTPPPAPTPTPVPARLPGP